MTIGFVLDDTLDKPDGVQHQVLTIGEWMRSKGHDVHYIVAATDRTDIPNIHSVSRFVSLSFNGNAVRTPLPASRGTIKKEVKGISFDAVYVQMPFSPLLGGKVIKILKGKTKLIGTFHIAPYGHISNAATRALGLVSRRYLKYFDHFTFVSEAARDFAKKTFKISGDYIPNCVDMAKMAKGKARTEYKPAKTKTVVFLGRLVERKGALYLLKALAYLKGRGTLGENTRVLIGGKGPLKEKLESYAKAHGLESTVNFLGFVRDEDKADLLASADVAVFPSSGGESFGIVLIEAMAAGAKVVLGGNNVGYQHVLGDSPQSLFDPKNTIQFASTLHAVLTDNTKIKSINAWQQKTVHQYDVAVVGKKLLNLAKR